ncbi:MAG TPA: hypothetical protein VM328_12770 [Fimbriimonadaceae bacterium]|nr:hypothetical protein [Fimbriimonadaceae bacterium]
MPWLGARAADWLRSFVGRLPDMGLQDCHTPGLDSIVLEHEADERGKKVSMKRIFVAHPGRHGLHRLLDDSGNYVLGVHTHRYDLRLTTLVGRLVNHEVRICSSLWTGEPIYERSFTSALSSATGTPVLSEPTMGFIREQRNRVLMPGESRTMFSMDLHTVLVPHEFTAWLVEEGPDRSPSRFYSRTPDHVPDTTGLYRPLSVSDATELLLKVADQTIRQ